MLESEDKRVIYLGSDHAGYQMKNMLKEYIEQKYPVTDLGTFSEASFDYPDIAREVGEKVLENKDSLGILLCGSGIGVCMAANKLKGIRAANCTDEHMAEMARRHNDANVLTIGARITNPELAKKIVDKFLTTDFESGEERHVRRVQKMDEIADLNK